MSDCLMPNLIGVGAPRCGTRAMYTALSKCEDVFVSKKKEMHYFNKFYGDWDEDYYASYFSGGVNKKYRCEITPSYLYSKKVAVRIKNDCPKVKILIQVRDPVERMISDFYNRGGDSLGDMNDFFRRGLSELSQDAERFYRYDEPGRIILNSMYADSIGDYLSVFRESQVFLVDLYDVECKPEEVMNGLSNWLGVNVPPPDKENSRARSQALEEDLLEEVRRFFYKDWERTKSIVKEQKIRLSDLNC